MDLYKFLKDKGFKIPDRNDLLSRQGYGSDFALPVSSSAKITLGTIYKTSSEPVEYGKIEIIYFLNAAQVKEVLKLREFLDKNNIEYKERGDKESVASTFRKESKELNSLADKLEGKIET